VFTGSFGQAGHHRHHGAGVDAARQEGAERHVGLHLALHRFAQAHDQLASIRLLGHARVPA
jgi:hypothetical protein